MPIASGYHCPLCPRSFHEDAGVRVHLTETHQFYDVLHARRPAVRGIIDLTNKTHLVFEPEPDIWTLLGHDEEDEGEKVGPTHPGGRAGAYIAILGGLLLILVAFLPH
ncbi:MAG TPA: hypothetical protein VNY84_05430 [Acidimicrobiales bacterium]|jgi:hypothetical protein|nr:hypothetical protein [Acidimicrobiales bacterium]